MSKEMLEKVALAAACAMIAGGVWFWILQIADVIELLQMAYGSE